MKIKNKKDVTDQLPRNKEIWPTRTGGIRRNRRIPLPTKMAGKEKEETGERMETRRDENNLRGKIRREGGEG